MDAEENRMMPWIFYDKRRRRRMTLHYIQEDEAERLYKIAMATPKAWAQQIIDRNKVLLECLRNKDWQCMVGIGCPHCENEYEICEHCAFQVGAAEADDQYGPICMDVPFGSVTCWHTGVIYCSDDAYLERCLGFRQERSRLYLLAHVEWAQKMIKRYGLEDED